MFLTGLLMTLPGDGIEAGGNTPIPNPNNGGIPGDTTEGQRGDSNTTRSNGDPAAVIMGNEGEVVQNIEEGHNIPNSTNAVTELAFNRLTPMTEVTVASGREIGQTYDLKPLFTEVLGTTNITPGVFNTAFRSINFRYPENKGQRACVVYKDGTVKFLSSGTSYADWYGQSRGDNVAAAAIIYFDQRQSAENPFVSVRWYKKNELPSVNVVDDSL